MVKTEIKQKASSCPSSGATIAAATKKPTPKAPVPKASAVKPSTAKPTPKNGLTLGKGEKKPKSKRDPQSGEHFQGLSPEPADEPPKTSASPLAAKLPEPSPEPLARDAVLTRLGFGPDLPGVHSSRTIMLEELEILLAEVTDPASSKAVYRDAVVKQNCLGKRSSVNRTKTFQNLAGLYALEPANPLFRALRFFWNFDPEGRPLLALLEAYTRDRLLRATSSFILELSPGESLSWRNIASVIDAKDFGHYSRNTLKSAAQNLSSSWSKAGFLEGGLGKKRARVKATAGSLSYALFLGYLAGARGRGLFESEYASLLECPHDRALDLAAEASGRGWINFKMVGNVLEVLFPKLITTEELEEAESAVKPARPEKREAAQSG